MNLMGYFFPLPTEVPDSAWLDFIPDFTAASIIKKQGGSRHEEATQ